MSILYTALGAAVLLLVVVDVVRTTLSASGDGPLTRVLGRGLWAATGHAAAAGPLVLVTTAAMWTGLLWIAWTLVFLGAEPAVVTASGGEPVGLWRRLYFAGYTVATLGLGDLVPGGTAWRLLTVLAAFSGLVLLTLGVTYYTAVLQAVVQKEQLAAQIDSLGDSPADVVSRAWDGEGFPGLDSVLAGISSLLALHTRRHYAYPALHYYRATEADHALAVQAARLHDALMLMAHAVAPGHRPPPAALRATLRSLDSLAGSLTEGFVVPADAPPPPPDVQALEEAGIPHGDAADAFGDADVVRRRRVLLGFVTGSRFEWADVDPPVSPLTASPHPTSG